MKEAISSQNMTDPVDGNKITCLEKGKRLYPRKSLESSHIKGMNLNDGLVLSSQYGKKKEVCLRKGTWLT
jgi:hypothetical protein